MKKIFLALAAVMLAGCSVADVSHAAGIPVPVEYAQRTAVDEQVGVGIELAYKGFRKSMELGIDTGVVHGAAATRVRKANVCAYRAVLVFRQAYKTANSADLLAAARSANIAIEQALAAFTGDNPCTSI